MMGCAYTYRKRQVEINVLDTGGRAPQLVEPLSHSVFIQHSVKLTLGNSREGGREKGVEGRVMQWNSTLGGGEGRVGCNREQSLIEVLHQTLLPVLHRPAKAGKPVRQPSR